MENRKAIVTGAYGAIGRAIAEGLAAKGYHTVLAGRDKDRLEKVAQEIIANTGNKNVDFYAVDLSRKKEIQAFAQSWEGPLHVLVNNAATTPRSREETPEGIELQFATNVLGYVWMMEFFHPLMENLEDARIVNVASYWAGDLDLNDLEFTKRRYNNDTAYRQTKQANRMLTAAYAEKFSGKGISVLAAHPGDVNSKLSNNLGYGGWESPEQGAATPLYCATDASLRNITGKYYENKQESPCSFAARKDEVQKLYEICQAY